MTSKKAPARKNVKSSPSREFVSFYLNGELIRVQGDDGFMMLADWLRKRAMKPGTKIVCAEGDCGACTVLRAFRPSGSKKKLNFSAMNSCIALVAQMDGSHLVTIEGLSLNGELAPVQSAMRSCHGSQCGYCTPGFVMALTGALQEKNHLDRKTAANYLTGNLCRCTGYSPILDAAENITPSPKHDLARRYLTSAAVKTLEQITNPPLTLRSLSGLTFFAPTALKDACQFLVKNPKARILGATTDIGVQTNKGKPLPTELLSLVKVPELYNIKIERSHMTVGARVNLTELRTALQRPLPEFARFLDLFASPQIKNVATLIGNLANASPIGDTLPFLLASDADVHVVRLARGKTVKRKIPMTEFFIDYKKLTLKPGELITSVVIPRTSRTQNIRLYKASQRKDLDISVVSGAFCLQFKKSGEVSDAALALGGIAATPVRLPVVERFLVGKVLSRTIVDEALVLINQSIRPLSDLRGSDSYRRVLVNQFFNHYVSTTAPNLREEVSP